MKAQGKIHAFLVKKVNKSKYAPEVSALLSTCSNLLHPDILIVYNQLQKYSGFHLKLEIHSSSATMQRVLTTIDRYYLATPRPNNELCWA